jgi:phosphoesterase RecJ-like protein
MTTRKRRPLPLDGRSTPLAEFCSALRRHQRFLLSCHVNPEGDAIGSMLAVESLLRRLGKKTFMVAEDSFPQRLTNCLPHHRWRQVHHWQKLNLRYDALVLTDCPSLERIGAVEKLIRPETVVFNIDHHISNCYFGRYNYVRPEAAATGEVVYNLFTHLGLTLTRHEAEYLYVALSTDTGSFKYGNTTARSHRVAADLISTGINVEKLTDGLYGGSSLNKIHLYSRLLSRVKTAGGGSIAWVGMKLGDLKRSGATYEDSEGFIDFLRYLKEVKVAFFMTEFHRRNQIKVSFRARGTVDVNRIALRFSGGGHKKASGCIIHASLPEAERQIVKQLLKELKGPEDPKS